MTFALVKDSVPPRVRVTAPVPVPLNVSPLTVPEPDTEVTVPELAVAPVAIPFNLVLSAALIEPAAEVVAAEIEITGAAPPLEAIGAVPVTPVTVPVFAVAPVAIPSNLLLSAALIDPAAEVVAAVIEIVGVTPPLETIGAVPETEATGLVDIATHSTSVPPAFKASTLDPLPE